MFNRLNQLTCDHPNKTYTKSDERGYQIGVRENEGLLIKEYKLKIKQCPDCGLEMESYERATIREMVVPFDELGKWSDEWIAGSGDERTDQREVWTEPTQSKGSATTVEVIEDDDKVSE